MLASLLSVEGYRLEFAESGDEALVRAAEIRPDLILLDVMMPGMDGYEVCSRMRGIPQLLEVPVVMVTALNDRSSRIRGLESGADDFLSKPIDRAELRARVRTITRLNRYRRISEERSRYEQLIQLSPDGIIMIDAKGKILLANEAARLLLMPETGDEVIGSSLWEYLIEAESGQLRELFEDAVSGKRQREQLEALVGKNSGTSSVPVEISLACHEWEDQPTVQCIMRDIAGRKAAEQERARLLLDVTQAYDTTIETLALALELRDRDMRGHGRRVAEMTVKVARAMGINDDEITHIRRGAFLHDIGKIAIPDSILRKAGPLSDEEWAVMRRHPVVACELLSQVSFLEPALAIPCHHHEKWDGTGYPNGLRGEEIPLAARIFTVVDVWDALSTDRIYAGARSQKDAVDYCRSLSGSHFDPRVVEAFLSVLEQEAGS